MQSNSTIGKTMMFKQKAKKLASDHGTVLTEETITEEGGERLVVKVVAPYGKRWGKVAPTFTFNRHTLFLKKQDNGTDAKFWWWVYSVLGESFDDLVDCCEGCDFWRED
jgi:hypothetical protein